MSARKSSVTVKTLGLKRDNFVTKAYIFPTSRARLGWVKSGQQARRSSVALPRRLAHLFTGRIRLPLAIRLNDGSADHQLSSAAGSAAVRHSSMGPYFRRELVWWDREFDFTGRPIRTDVRAAASEVWERACHQAKAMLDDASEAGALMEHSVMQISRYLDRRGTSLPVQDTKGLLMCAFWRRLHRSAAKLRRMELAGDINEVSALSTNRSCTTEADCRLDAEKAVRQLSARARIMYELRNAGFDWKEIAQMLGATDAAARAEYSRELKRVKTNMKGKCPSMEE